MQAEVKEVLNHLNTKELKMLNPTQARIQTDNLIKELRMDDTAKEVRDEMKDWDKTFIEIAEEFARHSTCVKRQVGAVLVKDLRILSTGYNGTPPGFCNCKDVFENGPNEIATKAIFYKNDFPSSLNSEKLSKGYYFTHHEFAERFEIHAEQNCIAFAARNGVSTEDCTLYITTAPCVNCAKIIIASKIKKVVYKEIYKNDFGIQLLKEANIEVLALNP